MQHRLSSETFTNWKINMIASIRKIQYGRRVACSTSKMCSKTETFTYGFTAFKNWNFHQRRHLKKDRGLYSLPPLLPTICLNKIQASPSNPADYRQGRWPHEISTGGCQPLGFTWSGHLHITGPETQDHLFGQLPLALVLCIFPTWTPSSRPLVLFILFVLSSTILLPIVLTVSVVFFA